MTALVDLVYLVYSVDLVCVEREKDISKTSEKREKCSFISPYCLDKITQHSCNFFYPLIQFLKFIL